jgi:hypothetical protein
VNGIGKHYIVFEQICFQEKFQVEIKIDPGMIETDYQPVLDLMFVSLAQGPLIILLTRNRSELAFKHDNSPKIKCDSAEMRSRRINSDWLASKTQQVILVTKKI